MDGFTFGKIGVGMSIDLEGIGSSHAVSLGLLVHNNEASTLRQKDSQDVKDH